MQNPPVPELRPALAAVLDVLRCPIPRHGEPDDAPLSEVAPGTLGCPDGHRFDLARHGQLNLTGGTPVPAHADTVEMVAARERFLAGGHYAAIDRAVAELLGPTAADLVVETGAGTAAHLAAAVAATAARRGLALDLSPAAARVAARQPAVASVVCDSWRRWPVASGSADAVLCLFAPRNPAEFRRVLGVDGTLVVATPEADHLQELRSELGLLSVPADKTAELASRFDGLFRPTGSRPVRERLDLDAAEVADLVAMGPNAHHAHRDPGAGHRSVTCAVTVTRWCPV